MEPHSVPIEVSARHIHLSSHDSDILFGEQYSFRPLKELSQPQQVAVQETVKVVGPRGELPAVRIIMPARAETQLEIAKTDGFALGIQPTVAVSGELAGSGGGVTIVGPRGSIAMERGVIVAQRHIHIAPAQAAAWGLQHLDIVSVRIGGPRGLVFDQVVIRSRPGIDELSFMIDTDEANAAGVMHGDTGEIIMQK
jgi:putative phosphotransacetylase